MKTPFTILCLLMIVITALAQDVTLPGSASCNTAVTGTWTVPCNVSAITVDVYGGGGGAGGGGGGSNGGLYETRGGGGGGGAAHAAVTINVTPGAVFTYTIGGGGCGGGNGSDGVRGDDGVNGGSSTFAGTDNGGATLSLTAGGGAYGGSGSGSENNPGNGGAGGTATGGTTNTAGTDGTAGNGGNGGSGGTGAGPAGGAGGAATNNPGSTYGGGGAGGGDSNGGAGAAGGILITYTTSTSLPAIPTIVALPATCSGDGSSTISNYDAGTTYSFTPAGPTAGAGGTISGMLTGTAYTAIASAGTCPATAPSNSFSNEPQLAVPATPVITGTAASCDADGSSTISNYNAAYTYTFTPAGPTAMAGGAIAGIVVATAYTVAANDGTCSSAETTSFTNEAMLTGNACDTTKTAINNISDKVISVKVYPNPAANELSIDYSNIAWSKSDATLQITNNVGQIVFSQVLAVNSSTQKLQISNYASGVYTISIKHAATAIAQGRFIKE